VKDALRATFIFTCLLAASACAAPDAYSQTVARAAHREVAVTFDDLPATHGDLVKMRDITTRLLRSLKANRVPAIGFVNEFKLHSRGEEKARTALLRQWLDAGFELGNHTYSHVLIDRVPFEAYKEDLIRGEKVTAQLLRERGMRLRYFRHTQLRTGPTPEYKKALEKLLAERGYTVAPVTIDNNDYLFADAYARAKARGDEKLARRIADAYIPYMEQVFAHFEKLSVEFLGYEVKQTLLLHANELNADYFDELARMMRNRGYRFITLDEALKDKAYLLPDAQVKKGLSWLHRWMIARGMEMQPEPTEPEFIAELFNAGRR
jgi:peptidoglycan/xylan/chitin deacetylase (PgdA/CDA1 family)